MFWFSSLCLHLEDGERRFQLCSDENDWFIPDLTKNTRGWWCPNIPGGFNYSKVLAVHKRPPSGSHYPPYARRLIQSVYDCKFGTSVLQEYTMWKSWDEYIKIGVGLTMTNKSIIWCKTNWWKKYVAFAIKNTYIEKNS